MMTEHKTELGGAGAVHIDSVLSQLGSFGPYQLMTLAMLSLPFAMDAIYNTHYVFTAYDADYRCRIDECEADGPSTSPASNENWITIATPQNRSRQCYRYASTGIRGCGVENFDTESLVSCDRWVYEDPNSFVAEFDLGCQSWKRTMIGSIRSIASLAALMFSGQLSDRFGRKVMICTSGTLTGVIGMAQTFSNSYIMFMTMEFLVSVFNAALFSAVFILAMEAVSKDKRLLYVCFLAVLKSLGGVFYGVIAWKVPYWRDQLRVVYAPTLLMIFYVFILDEGVRWLLSRGEKAKAIDIILKIARKNAINISEKTLDNLQHETQKDSTGGSPLMNTLKSRIMVTRLCVCFFWWISCSFVYFGFIISSVTLGGNKYLDFSLTFLVEIPAIIAVVYLPSKYGRKRCLLVSFFLGGTLCMALAFVPHSLLLLRTVTFLMGKLVIIFTFIVIYTYTSELFPTYTRNSMHSLCSGVGRLGSILAPQTPLLAVYMSSLPTLLFGVCSLVAGVLTFFIPDTRNARLPDNVKEAENIDNHEGDR